MRRVVLAGLSVRMLAESAAQAGYSAMALDLFGDADTRRVVHGWSPLGAPGELRIDESRLLDALLRFAHEPDPPVWIVCSGFESQPHLLAQGERILPLAGNPARTVQKLKDPGAFFAMLGALGIAHPETSLARPTDPAGWLCKHIGGCGGMHVRVAADAPAEPADHYFQRRIRGVPMSVLVLVDRGEAEIVGVNRLLLAPAPRLPCRFGGAIGSVPLAADTFARLQRIAQDIAHTAGLRGLNGIDFMLDDEEILVLEVNPRPPASMALHADAFAGGLLQAHLASLGLEQRPRALARRTDVRGFLHVHAERRITVKDELASAILSLPWCHDVPMSGAVIPAGAPFCTVTAAGATSAQAIAGLRQRDETIRHLLRKLHELPDDDGPLLAEGWAAA